MYSVPTGVLLSCRKGATAVDFAYAVHTDIGNTRIGARVNHRAYSLSKPLETGQTVGNKNSTEFASEHRLAKLCGNGQSTREKIRQYLKSQEADEAQQLGERLLRSALGPVSYDDIPESEFERVLKDTKVASKEELLKQIGLGNLMSIAIAKRLLGELQPLKDENASEKSLSIKGAEGLLVSFAKCCRPIPGDDIIAHVSPGKGLVIHRRECKNVRGHEDDPGRYFPVEWDNKPEAEFISEIRIEIINHQAF